MLKRTRNTGWFGICCRPVGWAPFLRADAEGGTEGGVLSEANQIVGVSRACFRVDPQTESFSQQRCEGPLLGSADYHTGGRVGAARQRCVDGEPILRDPLWRTYNQVAGE